MNTPSSGREGRFPAQVYRETVLERIFADAKRYFLGPLIEIEYAHTLMLARQQIMSAEEAAVCFRALNGLDRESLRETAYDGSFEDLFFLVERRLAEVCGVEIAGKMHTARSRNDIDLTMYRMVLRGLLLEMLGENARLCARLLELAWEHRASVMPAYTHGQPAQPTTLGHYLMAYVEVLERDAERLKGAFGRVNRSSMGACAVTTTGFPIDRQMTAELLGFSGVQVNSYGAIAAVDYVAESCSAMAVSMVSLGRFVQDLLLWSTAEFHYLRLSDAYVQVSSIMPQKRNPVPLEHVRALASRAMTGSQGVLGCLHNTPFADMNDAEDQLQPVVYAAFEDGMRGVRLLTGVLEEAVFDTGSMAAASDANFLPVTETADTLVRTTGISFHAAHAVVSSVVRELDARGTGYDAEAIVAMIEGALPTMGGATLREAIRASLSARHFVDVRTVAGGPALSALEPEIARAREQLVRGGGWIAGAEGNLRDANRRLHEQVRALVEVG